MISALRGRRIAQKFQAGLGYIARVCLKTKAKATH